MGDLAAISSVLHLDTIVVRRPGLVPSGYLGTIRGSQAAEPPVDPGRLTSGVVKRASFGTTVLWGVMRYTPSARMT